MSQIAHVGNKLEFCPAYYLQPPGWCELNLINSIIKTDDMNGAYFDRSRVGAFLIKF